MRPDKKDKKDKNIIALVRELDKLNNIARNAPVIPLEKPYQNGWLKTYALRDDYTRRADAQIYMQILKQINSSVFCRKIDFVDNSGKVYGPILQGVGRNQWEYLGWPDYYKKYFSYGYHNIRSVYSGSFKYEGYCINRPYFFIEVIKPHIVTHTRVILPEIETRIAEIRGMFRNNNLWARYDNLKGRRKHSQEYYHMRKNYLEALGTKEIEEYDKSE